ncbi:vWA domain-containing protein [Streptomyces rimosus]|uniref:vWA domain-containing protein n=1 Tax=Streptomyces rimosus TaxID=1927 RepID=UPI0004C95B13|nr:VWA domain-containing protein [Streptomyces rimosus]
MGIRSLLRNAFGRSKAAREESNEAASGTRTPEAATIPEAREEATPEPAAPRDPAVPTARTAPTDAPSASVPTQATTPDAAPAPKGSASDLVSQAFDNPKTPVRGEAAAEAEPEVVVPKAEPEATAEPKPEPEATTVAEPEPEPKAEAEAPAEPEAAVVVDPEPEAVAVATPKPEPEVTAEATPKDPKPETEPADKATPEPTETTPQPQSVPEAPASPAPPTSLTKIESQAPGLVSLYKAARVSLEKQGLATQRAAVYLVLDRSGSMRNYYKDGTVQHLAEQALGLSANLDDDGTVPVVFFSTDVDGTAELDLANYEGRIEELHAGLGHMGRTNYHWAINAVVEHYEKSGATDPAFVIFQTDGAPTSKPAAEKALCEAAKLPIFWQFVGFGDPDAKGFDFLRKLDELAVPEKRVIDNAGFFHAGRDPRSLADADLYQQLMTEFPTWLTEACKSGILPG